MAFERVLFKKFVPEWTLGLIAVKQEAVKHPSPAETAEAVRVQRLREDARRPMSVNLAEGIALSQKLIRFSNTLPKN
jgi:hypothetical protein